MRKIRAHIPYCDRVLELRLLSSTEVNMMKTFVVIFLSLAALELTLARTSDSQSDNQLPEDVKNPTKSKPTNGLGITDNLADILQEDDDGDYEVTIPTLKELTTTSDPLQLAQEINSIADPNKREELISKLEQAWKKNKDILPGKFYQAAYTSLENPEEGLKFWNKELQKETKKAVRSGLNIVERAGNDISGVFGNIQKVAEIDPLGIALLNGDSVLLTVLSDTSKNMGKISDLVYDTAGNVVGIHRKITAPFDNIPLVGGIKKNIDNWVENGLTRGKFLSGSFANTGTKAFAALARDSSKRAQGREDKLRQFTGGSTSTLLE